MKVVISHPYFKKSSILFVLFNVWLFVLYLLPNTVEVTTNYFQFIFLGVLGAIFANSTGAGGGVVFIPMFDQLGFTEAQSVATSFGIQCFGMTAGAITWWRYYRKKHYKNEEWRELPKSVLLVTVFSIAGVLSTQWLAIDAPATLKSLFKSFSIILGVAILATAYLVDTSYSRTRLTLIDLCMLIVIAFFGGIITNWLSVGVGELIAVYLILRRFNITMAIAIAVIISAFTVWSASIEHIWLEQNAYWQVVLFAGPGAVVGGILARKLVSYLPAKQLKIFFALWVLVIGVFS